MFSFKQEQSQVLGIDISATAVKLLELSKSGSGYKVESYAVEPLAAGSVSDNVITNIEAVGESIAKVVKKSRTKARAAAAAVSGPSVITKVISVPANLSEQELEEQVKIEAEQYLPFPLEEVAMDFEVLNISANDPDSMDVMLVASKSDNVDACVGVLELGGLTPKIIDIEIFAMEKAIGLLADSILAQSANNQIIAVADVGSLVTTFIVMENSRTIYSREQPFGGAQLTEEIERHYGLTFEEAGAAKRKGGLPDNYEHEVLAPFKETMGKQIARAQQFFYSSSNLDHIDHLVLSGGCASIDGVADVISAHIDVPTSVANLFDNMSVAGRVNKKLLHADAPAMVVACGLALRGFS